VEIIEAPEGGVDDVVAVTTDRFNGTKFDYRQEWPLRTAIVTLSGVPAIAVLCFCHLATDFGGSMLVLADLAAVIAGKVLTENTATQPVDLARYQQSPAGRRAAKAAATYWERAYERIPISMFERELAVPEEPRFHRAFLISPAMSQAVELVGERLGTGSSAVLHAAFAVTIAALTEHDTCALLTITKNRFRSQTRDMVSTLALEGLLVVSLADVADFDEAVRASWRAAVPAYRYAQYDELDRDRIVKEASDRRGEFVHPNCCLNDLRDDMATGIPFSGTPLRELAARSRIDWLPPLAKVDCRFCLHFEDTPIGMALRVTSDSAYVPRPHMIAFLKSVDAIVTAAAAGPVKLVDLPSMTELITS
ncbi:MAG TPA: hypothetical protein VH352_28500, partial [Pseudonocardiaceae bacterium]|nr:hypothetical protein [Pseudonocardiaceae bacterium]